MGELASKECSVELRDSGDQIVSRLNLTLDIENTAAAASAKLPDALKPGLYKLHARTTLNSVELSHASGFWIYEEEPDSAGLEKSSALDESRGIEQVRIEQVRKGGLPPLSLTRGQAPLPDLLISKSELLSEGKPPFRGKPFTVDKHFFYRDGKVFPVTGTTYMASDMHRRFLLDPNPVVWDNDFREMKEAGVNMIRTGIWTGWKKYMTEAGKMNEAVLRAFDAFLLTAHKYDIPVIFTFFAFLPETWGGENAYLDPRSIKAQQQFISAFTARCASC